jgi:hypothetical protein
MEKNSRRHFLKTTATATAALTATTLLPGTLSAEVVAHGMAIILNPEDAKQKPAAWAATELREALKARGVATKIAGDLVANHPAGRIQTKIDVFDWLQRNEDKRVGKNPAGYLVASIRSDYQAPGDFPNTVKPAKSARPEAAAAEEAKRQDRKASLEDLKRDQAREDELRDAWKRLSESEREEIQHAVKAANPGLSRWKTMLEPLCFSALEERLNSAKGAQRTLFPDA